MRNINSHTSLDQPEDQVEINRLIAILGSKNGNGRWLAMSTLIKLRETAVVNLLAAYRKRDPSPAARAEAQSVLKLIGEMSEDEG